MTAISMDRKTGRTKRALALLSACALAVGMNLISSLVQAPPAAAAAPVDCMTLYAVQQAGNHSIYSVNRTTGQRTVLFNLTGSPGALSSTDLLNGLAIDPRDGTMYAVSQVNTNQTGARIYQIDPVTEQVTVVATVAWPTPVPANTGVVMGTMTATGILYYGYVDTNWRLHILGFNVDTRQALPGEIGWVQLDDGNGDMVLDATNNLWIVSGNKVYRTVNPLSSTGGAGGQLTVSTWASQNTTTPFNSVAVGPDGYIYVGSGATIANGGSLQVYKVNPSQPGNVVALPSTQGGEFSDMASCSAMNVIRVQKDLPDGRSGTGDQFDLRIAYNGATQATARTTGNENGLQASAAEVAVLGALPSSPYTVSESAASGSLANYVSTYKCTGRGAPPGGKMGELTPIPGWELSGTGTTASVSFPEYPAGSTDTQYATGIQVTCVFTNSLPAPSIKLDKTTTGATAVGDNVPYEFTVTNTGNVPLSSVHVTDPMTGAGMTLSGCDNMGTLQPGDHANCTGSYTVTQPDFDNGTLTNTATATGTPPTGGDVTDDDSATVDFTGYHKPSISLDKATTATQVGNVGDVIPYTFLVENTGNVTLTHVHVTDALDGVDLDQSCADLGTLAPGDTASCTGTYAVRQSDTDAGRVINLATATGTPPKGDDVTGDDTEITPAPTAPGIQLDKSATEQSYAAVGDVIHYTFLVTNIGNATLTHVKVTDPLPGIDLASACGDLGSLGSGKTASCTGTYTVKQSDLDAGHVANTATATGTPPTGTDVTDDDTATVDAHLTPSITLTKTPDHTSVSGPGQPITYTFEVKNTGNVKLTGVKVTDTDLPGIVMDPSCATLGELAAGASTSCTGTYTASNADANRGTISNTATATGTPPTGPDVTAEDTATVTIPSGPNIKLSKTAAETSVSAARQVIHYTFTVSNMGNVTLTDVTVTDPLPGMILSGCDIGTLAAGVGAQCWGTYVVTQADIDAGVRIDNTATVKGTPPTGPDATDTDTASVDIAQHPSTKLTKTADVDTYDAVGDVITYTFTVLNNGNTTKSVIKVTDSLPNIQMSPACDNVGPLAPGETGSCTATYTITQADLDAGQVKNSASDGDDTDEKIIDGTDKPAIQLVKTGVPTSVATAGQTIDYTLKVTNTGNVTLKNVKVTDDLADIQLSPGCANLGELAPEATASCTASYTVKQSDLDTGSVTNVAHATGTPPRGADVTADDTWVTPAHAGAAIQLVKTATETGVDAKGQVIHYTFKVTNTGDVTLHDVHVVDSMPNVQLSPECGTLGTLAPGASASCSGTYTVTQPDLDTKTAIVNTASAIGSPPSGSPVSADDSANVPVNAHPHRTIDKVADVDKVDSTDDVITYTFTVTNDGNVTLHDVSVVDRLADVVMSPLCANLGDLAPGASASCTGTYQVKQSDLDAGQVVNTAASGDEEDTVIVPVDAKPAIQIVKQASPATVVNAGTTITYTFVVTNTGNQTLSNVNVTDPMVSRGLVLDASCASLGTLAPKASTSCTGTYVATQGDIDAGSIVNTATAKGTPPPDPDTGIIPSPVTDDDTRTVQVSQGGALDVTKVATETSVSAKDQVIHYTFTVTNSGNVKLTAVHLTDPLPGMVLAPECATLGDLEPGASAQCTGTYPVTQADLDRGSVRNTATATGTPPSGPDVTGDGTATVPADQHPSLKLVKSADVPSVSKVGDVITYTFTVTNDGNVKQSGVKVTDPMTAHGLVLETKCANLGDLAAGASASCTGTYSVTQADLNAGKVENTATATGNPPSGPPTTATDTATVPATQGADLTLLKTASPSSVSHAGETVTYTFKVTNTGNVKLTGVKVTDPLPGIVLGAACATLGDLEAGASAQCTGTYTVLQSDLDHGSIVNTATATGTPPTGPDVTGTDSETVDVTGQPSLNLVKSADVTSVSHVGDVIKYTFTVTNDGNVQQTGVKVTDPMTGLALESKCANLGDLAPGASASCTGTYAVTQDDLDAGKVMNTATATGNPPSGPPTTDTDTKTVPSDQNPGVQLVKQASPQTVTRAGQVVTYTFVVTNTGNVTLSNAKVEDRDLPGLTLATACANLGDIAPAATASCTGTYTVTQDDIDAGKVTNTATVTANPPGDNPPVTDDDTKVVTVPQGPAIAVNKVAAETRVSATTDVVHYTFTVTNTGNVKLTDVHLTDPLPGIVLDPGCATLGTLEPGESAQCAGTYAVKQSDLDKTKIENTATATGTPPTGDPVHGNDTNTVPVDVRPALTLTKTADVPSVSKVGDVITYTFTVRNTGNVSIAHAKVTDDKAAVTLSAACADLGTIAPNGTASCTGTYTVTQADLDAAAVTNSAVATGTPPAGPDPQGKDEEVTPTTDEPSLQLVKHATPALVNAVDQVITYTFQVTNTGNVTLKDVAVSDQLAGVQLDSGCANLGSLAPGKSASCSGTYKVTQADLNRGHVANAATASGTTPEGPKTHDDDSVDIPASMSPQLTLAKTANVATVSKAGDVITYTFRVTNTGNVSLTDVNVRDNLPNVTLAPACATLGTLTPGQSATCTGSYTATQQDIDRGKIVNAAVATGTPPSGPAVQGQDSTQVNTDQASSLSMTKTADKAHVSKVGDVITYTFVVRNTGAVTISDITLEDNLVGVVLSPACSALGPLAPGATASCTGTYTVKQTDLNAGKVTNSAVVKGKTPDGKPVDGGDDETTTADEQPGIQVVKRATPTTVSKAGDVITYLFTVTNTGNVTLSAVTVSDELNGIALVGCDSLPDLQPGKSATCAGTYTVTQADINAGGVTNVAAVTAKTPSDKPTGDDDTVTVHASDESGVTLDKVATPKTVTKAGDVVTYTFTVTNTGNTTLTNVAVTDPMDGVTLDNACKDLGTLRPGAKAACTATYVVKQRDLDAGKVQNTATVTATPPNGVPITDDGTETVTTTQQPSVVLAKTTSAQRMPGVGGTLTYTFTVTNTGNVTLTNVVVTDPLSGLALTGCELGTLAPGRTVHCTGTYTVTQADVDRGSIVNTATVTAKPPTGPNVDDNSTLTVRADSTPGISLTKSVDAASVAKAGTAVNYRFTATNTGNVTLTGVVVADPLPGLAAPGCSLGTIDPGQSKSCTIRYVVTQADLDAGHIVNHATVTGNPPSGAPVSDDATNRLVGASDPAVSVVKSVDKTAITTAGEKLTYTFRLTNTGNVTLTKTNVTDTLPAGIVMDARCADLGTLAPGQSASCTGVYTVTAADLDAGHVYDVAAGSGTPPSTTENPTPTPIPVTPSNPVDTKVLDAVVGDFVWNDRNGNGVQDAGEPGIGGVRVILSRTLANGSVVTYETMTNAQGAYTFSVPPSGATGYTVTFEAPAGARFTTAHQGTSTALDSDAVFIVGMPGAPVTGAAIGVVGIGGQTDNTIDAGLYFPAVINQLVWNDENHDGIRGATESVLPDVTVTLTGKDGTGAPVTMSAKTDANGVVTFVVPPSDSAGYTLTVAKPDGKAFTTPNVGADKSVSSNVDASGVAGPITVRSGDTSRLNAGLVSSRLAVSKTADPASGTAVKQGDVVTYTLTFGNPVPAAPASVDYVDDLSGVVDDATVRIGGITVTPAVNCQDAAGAIPGTCQLAASGMSLTSSADMSSIRVSGTLQPGIGVKITYSVTVGASLTTGDHLLKNKLTAPDGPEIITENPVSQLLLTKEGKPMDGQTGTEGDTIVFTFRIANVGKTTIHDITLTDAMPGLSAITFGAWPGVAGVLAPTESVTATALYKVTAADVLTAFVVNQAGVTGMDPDGNRVTSEAVVSVPLRANPAVSLDKQVRSSSGSQFVKAGDKLNYTFTITNTGDITLHNINVTDPMAGLGTVTFTWPGAAGILAPGQRVVATASYTVTATDIVRGKVVNTATVIGDIPGWNPGDPVPPSVPNSEVSATDTATFTIQYQPAVVATGGTVSNGGDWPPAQLGAAVLLGAALVASAASRRLARREEAR